MTVSSELNRKQYTGDGVTTSFATSPVVFFETSDLVVYAVTTATGASTTLTENTHYTVSGGSGSTGTVNLAGGSSPYGAPSASQTLVIVRDVPLTQEVDLVQNDASDAEVMEDSLDKLTMISQQLSARLDRSFVLADSDVSGVSVEIPTPTASRVLGWNSDGDGLTNYAASSLGAEVLTTAFTESLLDDASAGVFVETLRGGLTEDTAPAIDDEVITRDTTNTTGKRMTLSNVFKVINSMTVDSAPDAEADYVVTYDASASGPKKAFPYSLARVPSGAGRNITARTNASNPNTQIDIDADELIVRDTSGRSILLSSVNVTADITASGANGLDTGAEGGDTWYYGWVIYNPTTATVAGLISASATAPTTPSGYTFKALVTAVRNNGSSNFLAYRQFGNQASFQAEQSALSGGTATTETAVSLAAVVPPIAHEVTAHVSGVFEASGGAYTAEVSLGVVTGSVWASLLTRAASSAIGNVNSQVRFPNISQNLYYYWNGTTNLVNQLAHIDVQGFKLPLGGE